MKKIISLFQRNYDGDKLVRDEVVPGAEWVLSGEGVATVKHDGTACMVRDGVLFKRYDCKKGRTPPNGWEPCEPKRDEHTGHWPGWVRVGDGPEDRWHREVVIPSKDGTYELVGPKVQGNPYHRSRHSLWKHGLNIIDAPRTRTFSGLRQFFLDWPMFEGIVYHHPDGRMVKIKRSDFGLEWPVRRIACTTFSGDKGRTSSPGSRAPSRASLNT